jgi:hypothetical protein
MKRRALALLYLTACGRLAFDPLSSQSASDASPTNLDAATKPIAFVQHAENMTGAASTSISVQWPMPQTAGNMNILVFHHSFSQAITSVTDTSGNTYVLAVGPVDHPNTGQETIMYAPGIAAATSNTVTVAFDMAGGLYMSALEYAGLSRVDVTTSNIGSSTAMDSGTLTTTRAPTLLFAAALPSGSTITSDPAFTDRTNLGGGEIEDRIASAAGPFQTAQVQDVNNGWVLELVAFSP